MRFKFYCWFFDKALSKNFCNQVIKHGKKFKPKKGTLASKQKNMKIRDSNVVFLTERWIYREIQPYMHLANKNAGWNLQVDYSEACQFTEYTKGQHYEWHYDMFKESYNNPKNENLHGKTRKLSMVVSLSDEKDYEGGDLEFDSGENSPSNKENKFEICRAMRNKGSIIVFPSFIYHRVTPVTKGKRHSLVTWNIGNPYR